MALSVASSLIPSLENKSLLTALTLPAMSFTDTVNAAVTGRGFSLFLHLLALSFSILLASTVYSCHYLFAS